MLYDIPCILIKLDIFKVINIVTTYIENKLLILILVIYYIIPIDYLKRIRKIRRLRDNRVVRSLSRILVYTLAMMLIYTHNIDIRLVV